MFLSLFKEYRKSRAQAITASLPECIVIGEGEWYLWGRTSLGTPILRLFRSPSDAGDKANQAREFFRLEIPKVPDDLGPWVPKSLVRANGPFLVGHRYRWKSVVGRSPRQPAHVEIIDAECVARSDDPEDSSATFKIIADNSKNVDKDPQNQPDLLTKLGNEFTLYFDSDSDFSDFVYLGQSSEG